MASLARRIYQELSIWGRIIAERQFNHMFMRATVKNMKMITTNATIPSDESKMAIFRLCFLKVKIKIPATDNSATRAKRAEKGN